MSMQGPQGFPTPYQPLPIARPSIRASGSQSLANATFPPAAKMPLTAEAWKDSFFQHDNVANNAFITVMGDCRLLVVLRCNGFNTTRDFYIRIYKNGVSSDFCRIVASGVAVSWIQSFTDTLTLKAGDTLAFDVYQDSGGTQTIGFAVTLTKE